MGGNRRRRRHKAGNAPRGGVDDDVTKARDDGGTTMLVRIESSTPDNDGDCDGDNDDHPPAWSVDYVMNVERRNPPPSKSNVDISYADSDADAMMSSITDIGLLIIRGTLDKITRRNSKRSRKKGKDAVTGGHSSSDDNITNEAKPTPVQLRLWPALLDSLDESKSPRGRGGGGVSAGQLNVVGIAPTGTGKTMSYLVPIVSHCVMILLRDANRKARCDSTGHNGTSVRGLVLVPTRELAIQVSKECTLVCKVANKYLTKNCAHVNNADDTSSIMRVESLPVYGGVEIESQMSMLMGRADDESTSGVRSCSTLSLVVAATPGRLLDILSNSDDERLSAASAAFGELRAIVFDEADRMAMNAEMAGQVDDVVSILTGFIRTKRGDAGSGGASNDGVGGELLSCLVSATFPEKAREMCEKWVPRSRVVVRVDSAMAGRDEPSANNRPSCGGDMNAGEDGNEPAEASPSERNASRNLDLSSIPSNIVQTLHVCSNHKKPRKLILTLQRIYARKDEGKGRFTSNNRLTIAFFGQIKTVKYVSKLLVKEGLRCVELYGSLHQTEREKRLLEFKSGKTPILLATDIAARGIHINNVHYVVNYDFPSSLDQYVHRCGRAGRKEALNGEVSQCPPTVYSFFPREFSAMASSVVDLLKTCRAWVDPNLIALAEEIKASAHRLSRDGQKKRKRENEPTDIAGKNGETQDDDDSDNDRFSFLGKSVLKRAGHVSAAEDSDDDESI